jgi:predicted AAA+ superfamily ATPase
MEETRRIFRRKIYDKMLQWKNDRHGETALLIQGARRIGKSTIVEEFAKNEYESYILIDFSAASEEITNLFNDLSDLNYIFLHLQLAYHVQLIERKSVIIFDEVQKQPLARQAIKHLVKDHRYDYIETGSLISIRRNIIDIVIPSEETKVDMYPLDYEEFKWAVGDKVTIPLLRTVFEKQTPLGEATHRRLMRDFRLYMLVGGMPKAVDKYIESNNLSEVDKVKRDIISLYEEDFRKLDETGKATAMFDAIPSLLSKNVSRYTISSVIPGEKQGRVAELVNDMYDSKTVNVAYHSDDPNVGLALTKDIERYKMYLADTGLFVSLAFKDKDFTENIIYEKLLNDKLNTNLGYVYENVVAQMLRASGHELYYHTFLKPDGKNYYEVDFLLSKHNKICPIEVKSSGYSTHVSLDNFVKKYSSRINDKYIIYTKDIKKEKDVLYLPVYMTMFL